MKDVREGESDRRDFLRTAGKFAVAAPAVTFLLSTTMTSTAIAQSAEGGRGNEGCGNGPDPDPSPNNPDKCPHDDQDPA
jgi:hypothetical protein